MSKQQPYTQTAASTPAPLTDIAAARLRDILSVAQNERAAVANDRAGLDQRIAQGIAERDALDTVAADLDETITRYQKRLADHVPSQQWNGPQTGVFQAPELAHDKDAALRPSQARDNIPVPAGKP